MRTLPRGRAPFWFQLLVAVSLAAIARSVWPAGDLAPVGPHVPPAPSLAFFAFLVAIGELIWKGLEVAEKITVKFLAYSLGLLWKFARLVASGAHELAGWTWTGLRKGWQLLRLTYSHVLKPAWTKVWKWIDRAERWFETTFGPVLKWLRRIRTWVLDFYAKYVRPILDLMDVTRRALRVLASLGVDWARALDVRLAALEARIERPFRLLLAKLNEVINVVNRIMTADGLFQRLTFLRTLKRDYIHAWKVLVSAYQKPFTEAQQRDVQERGKTKSLEQVTAETREYMQTRGGPAASLLDEMTTQWRRQLHAR